MYYTSTKNQPVLQVNMYLCLPLFFIVSPYLNEARLMVFLHDQEKCPKTHSKHMVRRIESCCWRDLCWKLKVVYI